MPETVVGRALRQGYMFEAGLLDFRLIEVQNPQRAWVFPTLEAVEEFLREKEAEREKEKKDKS